MTYIRNVPWFVQVVMALAGYNLDIYSSEILLCPCRAQRCLEAASMDAVAEDVCEEKQDLVEKERGSKNKKNEYMSITAASRACVTLFCAEQHLGSRAGGSGV